MTAMLSPKVRQTRRARSKSMVMGEMSRSATSSRCAFTTVQQRALKAGWLKKQRSIMKNWQLRWFVLRPDQLYFYKDEEETKPQGCIPLHGSQVNELAANPDDPGRHLFEIVPGGAGEKDRTTVSHEAFLLMANSQNEMEDWVKAIRRAIWAPFGGGIFGQRLEDTVQFERKFGQRPAPLLVEQCVDFIRERGLDEEGLFRMPGQANLVKELQDAFDCGDKPLFNSNTDVHTVASLLKLYLRELPEPVVPFSQYQDFLTCAQLLAKDEEDGIEELAKQVKTLPLANHNLLKYICKFLDEVQSHSSQNKMSVQNLATVFGPNILRPKMEDPMSMMEGTSQVQHLMTVLIREQARLYRGPDGEASSAGPLGDVRAPPQRHAVEWISEEDLQTRTSSSSAGGTSSLAAGGDSGGSAPCLEVHAAAPLSAVSPSKQGRSVPGWRCSFRGPGARLGGSSVDVSSPPSGNWLMNGLTSLRSHRRTSSGERVRTRDSSGSPRPQRLSTYDNVTVSSLSAPSVAAPSGGGGGGSGSAPWASSSCDISLADSASASGSSAPGGGWRPEAGFGPGAGLREEAGFGPGAEPGSSSEALERCVSSLGCSENGSADDGSGGGGASALAHLVGELKDELRTQKGAYETRIRKLEESSAALGTRVERLEAELDQERKKQGMLEIKLRNSERAREDGEKRNRLLQTEMEEFFSTLGDLTLGTRTGNV
ncbi:rho GTPase-activating protein 22 isoform X2 [Anguilla anguilla]|uniref:rho GTPase-activating protein 22 isoform X2 n=1 Tax=Anguilla anguilla TaxID=7936 RepID=UPI0015B22923|nr:rho GTPase-activating protein 22 isoform X2 [Anguilla anguilla]